MNLTDTDLPDGTIVMLGKDGRFVPMALDYTRAERAIRWLGRLLHVRQMSRFHERIPLGVVIEGSVVMSGAVRVEYTPPPGIYE